MLFVPLFSLVLAAPATGSARTPSNAFATAVELFRAGDFGKAAHVLPTLGEALPKNRDYYLYFLGESQFYAGAYAKARMAFSNLGKLPNSRFAPVAPWRVADCLWMEGNRAEAAASYRKLLGSKTPVDRAVARFRLAETQAETARQAPSARLALARDAALRAYMQVHVDFPAHPLGIEAGKRANALAPAVASATASSEPSAKERLARAATLAKDRRFAEAIDELARLPADLPVEQAVERDLALGMAKYHARRDYAQAAELLLAVASRLTGEKAAFAAFHGARSLSRIDRDDEAIANYRKVVATYPGTRWAAEAQFRSGWLEINRGHFHEALPGLRETLVRFPKSAFADDAAWYIALAHFLLGQAPEALAAITTYEHVAQRNGEEAALRACYWRARILTLGGQAEEAKRLLRDCAARAPFQYYGLLAQARLRAMGESMQLPPVPVGLPVSDLPRDPAVERALELERAGLAVEAGVELGRDEAGLVKRVGRARALPFLLTLYPRLFAYQRADKLAESSGEGGLPGNARLFWEAAYPRAYPDAVESYGKSAGNPELFAYAIMRKESGYFPFAVSSSDARGLLQLLPSTGELVAKKAGRTLFADELFDPAVNIQLGTAYLGGLYRRFQGQEALAAGAYNAGAHAMMRWCDQWGKRPLDEFVELITYDQAREYIKRVLGIYARYHFLYAKPLELPLTVDPNYLKDGSEW